MDKKERVPFKSWDAGIILGATYLLGSIISIVLNPLISKYPNFSADVSYAIIPITTAIILLVYGLILKKDFGFTVGKNSIKPVSLILSPFAGIGLLAMLMIFNYVAVYIGNSLGVEMTVTIPSLDTPLEWFLAILSICVLPPLTEETVFRGIFLSSAENGGTIVAIFFSAMSFALFHFNLAQFVYPLVYGTMLAIVARKTGSTIYGMIMHFVNNLTTLVLTKTGWISFLDTFSWENIGILFAICLLGFGVFTVSFLFMTKPIEPKKYIKLKDGTLTGSEKLGIYLTLAVLLVVWLAMIIYNVVK